MDHHDLTGYYTYRSLLNEPKATGDFNDVRFGEGELFLWVSPAGDVTGTLAFPADPLAGGKEFMDMRGRVTSWSPPTIEWEGLGRPGTGTDSFDYEYRSSLAPAFAEAIRQRPTLVGSVLRAKPHGQAPAGVTASLVAVKRDFLMPKEIPGVALISEAVAMLAGRGHRLHHAVWHAVRNLWHPLSADAGAVEKIEKRGWWPERPPFLPTGAVDLGNGAGEDFLFMHRKMIAMLKGVYEGAGQKAPAGWTRLPRPDVAQTVYVPAASPGDAPFVFDPESSGYMVPPPIREDLDTNGTDRMMKSPAFLTGVMRPLELRFRSPAFLSSLTLGALGALIEWTIHGWMHLRWTHTTYDLATGEPIERGFFDTDPKWDDPSNDDLGDFYSSHVHPTFWRLHGWIDDRINDWARANAGRVRSATVDGVPWFESDGRLVQVREPFDGPAEHAGGHHHHGHHDDGDMDVMVMEEVMAIMQEVLEQPAPAAARAAAIPLAARSARDVFTALLLGAGLGGDLEG